MLQLRALREELGKHPPHSPAVFLLAEALGSSEAEVWFSQVNKVETPVGISQQTSIVTLELRFELTHLVRFSLGHCHPFSWLARSSSMPVNPWSSRKVILET